MQTYFSAPYPARSTVGISSLPRGALFEVEAVMVLA
jgi:enamine deaminase RidA (YjgF/YER057c/UK114 family)